MHSMTDSQACGQHVSKGKHLLAMAFAIFVEMPRPAAAYTAA